MFPKTIFPILLLTGLLFFNACLPQSDPYPNKPPQEVINAAQQWSGNFEAYIKKWMLGQAGPAIPDSLIPKGIADSKNFYLKHPDAVTPAETWAVRLAKPINKDSLYTGIPDPRVTYLYLGTSLAPFGSKLVIEGEFPHCRFFSIQATPPLNGKEYYAQRVFGTAEVSLVDADIEPLAGHTNPFRPGANRNANKRSYRVEFDLASGDPTALNDGAHEHPYRKNSNTRKAAMITYQGPLGYKTVAGTNLPVQGDWDLGALWLRIYAPDDNTDALGGVPLPKAWFELPDGSKYFVGSDFSALQQRADKTIANRITNPVNDASAAPQVGWFKSWGITRSMLNGVCLANNWSRPDSGARVNQIDLGWTGRGENQPAPGNIEPHATTNNYATYLGRSMSVPAGKVAVLTGKLPTFPATRNGEAVMQTGQVRYWSICGIDQDPLSPLPATTIHAISDDEVVIDNQRNYMIVYSRPEDRPANASAANGVSWVNWGRQSSHGLLMRWINVAPDWTFALAPQEHNLDWAHSDWSGSKYDSTLIGVNWRNGFLKCYLPKVHLLDKAEFEALGNDLEAGKIPVWVYESLKTGPSEALLGSIAASSLLDNSSGNAAVNANDNNYFSAWSSAFGEQNAEITVDLGSSKIISAVKLFWDWVFFAKAYQVEVSDNQQNWQVIATVENGDGQIDLFKNLKNVRARFVRLRLTQYNAGWYRLGEFEVYTNDCDCEAPPLLQAPTPTAGVRPLSLRCWPNPAQQYLRVSGDFAGQSLLLDVYDQQGVLRIRQRYMPGDLLDVASLLPGVYTVLAHDAENREATGRFVVLR